ncbi:MAG: class I SAM-dependent methyltransferase [Deltaproteobacteria bacterium]|nr:class I SAM-dependent methyltransferase [Nannocystaceae bacterium]
MFTSFGGRGADTHRLVMAQNGLTDVTMSHSRALAVANPANAPSARFFAGIGIIPAMRVLDVGCGNGDLSRFIAGLVGPDGEVVAIDRGDAALEMARAANAAPHAAPIHYGQADLACELSDLGRFDAIVGRRVLMYLPDAAATLARLTMLAKPGAIVAFQEHARAGLPAGLGELAVHRQLYDWVWSTVAAEGGDVGLGLRLVDLMLAAGLTIKDARSEGVLLQPGEPSFLPTLARAMLPRLIESAVVSAEDVGLETLADRLDAERDAVGGTIVWDLAFLVSARVAGS